MAADSKPAAWPIASDFHTYHCPCTSLLLASTTPLAALTRRKIDGASILPLITTPALLPSPGVPHVASLRSSLDEYTLGLANGDDPKHISVLSQVIVRLEDGVEKRYLLRCDRCELPWGYALDWASWGKKQKEGRREDVVYILKGGVEETERMGQE